MIKKLSVIADNVLDIPRDLFDAVELQRWRKIKKEAVYLIFHLIESIRLEQKTEEWSEIWDGRFQERVPTNDTKSFAKDWLKKKGFIEVKTWETKTGEQKPQQKRKGKDPAICRSYKLTRVFNERTQVYLEKRKLGTVGFTAPDSFCQITRRNLNKLEINLAEFEDFYFQERVKDPASRTLLAVHHGAFKLLKKCGSVTRGSKVNRLYSPWSHLPRIARPYFYFGSEEIVNIDLKCCQPTLLASLSDDHSFLKACFHDEIYQSVMILCECSRDAAKDIFLHYLFGSNKTPKHRKDEANTKAFRVTEYMRENYPTAFNYVWQIKEKQGKQALNHLLVNKEASIFIDGVLAKLDGRKIPALTIHDSVSVPAAQEEIAVNIVSEEIKTAMTNPLFKLDIENLNQRTKQTKIYK